MRARSPRLGDLHQVVLTLSCPTDTGLRFLVRLPAIVRHRIFCAGSCEHAPQALHKAGFRAVIAQSFAEIFFGNCATLGMPCVTATAEDIEKLATAVEANPQLEITIDVEKNRVFFGEENFTIHVADTARDAFLSARWDPIAELLEGKSEIEQTSEKLAYF